MLSSALAYCRTLLLRGLTARDKSLAGYGMAAETLTFSVIMS